MTDGVELKDDQAWVTLATNETYAIGALVLAHSLKKVGTEKKLAVLVTKSLESKTMRKALEDAFDVVQDVEEMDSYDTVNLELLKRPELGITFTKIHCWCLTQFSKCVFLDADTFVMKPCDELFDREELSAAPDAGWPDCFNSGVFVFKPSTETFKSLVQFAQSEGSFDGGDQGLLNSYFDTWSTKDIQKHLPFVYNMCATATYTYLPAYKKFGETVKIVHFIGMSKPWDAQRDSSTGKPISRVVDSHASDHLEKWWILYENHVKPLIKHLNSLYVYPLAQPPKVVPYSFSPPQPQMLDDDNSLLTTDSVTLETIVPCSSSSSSETLTPPPPSSTTSSEDFQDVSLLGSFSAHHPSLASEDRAVDPSSSRVYVQAPQHVHVVAPPKDNRLSWEKGCPDYMGTASFDKILERINTTLLEEKDEEAETVAQKRVEEDES